MKTIGLIGGMSWESSAVYYEIVNKKVKATLGGFASCKCLMYSVDFAEIEGLQHAGNWDKLNDIMADAAIRLEKGGADIIILCTNTMHLCSEAIIKAISVPFLHIADATGQEIKSQNLKKVGLLGTKFTMEKDFYKRNLMEKHGIETIIPDEREREEVHRIIYEELVMGQILANSRETYKQIIKNLQNQGAEGDNSRLYRNSDADIPV